MHRLSRARRALALAPLTAAAWLVTACTGTSTGTVDPNAPGKAGEKAQDLAVHNGKVIAALLFALVATSVLAWLWRSPATKIMLALVAGGAIVYFAMGGK